MRQPGNRALRARFLILFALGPWQLLSGEESKHPRTGDFKDDFKNPKTGALAMHYRMRVPEKLPASKTLGLIVAFHGLHGNENDQTGFAMDAAKRIQVLDEYVIMGGKSKGEGWDTTDDKDVIAWITWTRETYPIDPRRIHILGMSNGGGMVKRLGWANQDLFASVSSYCGVSAEFSGAVKGPKAPPARGPLSPAETRTEWYFVHGDADKTVPVDTSRLAIKQLAVKGYRSIYREIDGADHVDILRNSDIVDDNFRFLHALRHKEAPLTKDQRAMLGSMANKLKGEKAEVALPLLAEAARLGGLPAAGAIKSALGNTDEKVRKAAIQATEQVIFGREVILELVKLTRDKTPDVKAAAFQSLGALANWRYPEAQEFLLQTARKSTGAVDDRIAAIQGLTRSMHLMSFGSYEEKDLPWCLVLLLEDKETRVREAAFSVLKPGLKETFGYAPDLAIPERKQSVAKLRAWCEKVAGPLKAAGARS